jgi:tRNA A-37 threonylcarbamoyl transferase component Bud32
VTAPGSPTIPSRCPRREDLRSRVVTRWVAGEGGKADVFTVNGPGGEVVVKDFAGRALWARLLGRFQIAREVKAYAWLRGARGVPEFVGRIDALALALEKIEGERLAFAELPPGAAPGLLAELRAILNAIHERGVVHNDLRGRENVLLRADGGLAVLDFAAAIRLRPGGFAHRLLFRALAATDEAAFLKWKGMLAPGSYTPDDEAFLARFERRRALWPFNPKRRKAKARAA